MQLFEITQPETEKEIDRYIDQAKSAILGKKISPKKIAKIIQRRLRPRYGITVNAEIPISGLDPNNVIVNGYFDMSAWDKKNNIEIVIAYHKDNEDNLIIGPDDWQILSFRIKQTLMHELIHRAQYTQRDGFDPDIENEIMHLVREYQSTPDDKQRAYLSNADEIEAHSHDIALELRNSISSVPEIKSILRNFSNLPKKPDKSPSLSLWVYSKYFNHNPNHPIIKTVLKKTYKYLQHYMEI